MNINCNTLAAVLLTLNLGACAGLKQQDSRAVRTLPDSSEHTDKAKDGQEARWAQNGAEYFFEIDPCQ
ncbi:MAG: hypothetical protein ACT4PZ_19110 [Panacagrimonas sp.]